jgi:hypothetical protein
MISFKKSMKESLSAISLSSKKRLTFSIRASSTKVYYTDQTDEWRRNKLGQNYEINERFSAIPVSQISLRWLSKFGFNLELEEWYSISSIREHNKDESTPIKGEPVLAVILQQAVKMACIQGKNKKQVSVVSG